MRTAHRALLKSGVHWSMVRPLRRFRARTDECAHPRRATMARSTESMTMHRTRPTVARHIGYRTRVSAMRVEAGCATERLSARRRSVRHTRYGVQVADGWLASRPERARTPRSD
jgi:hypothetical protein